MSKFEIKGVELEFDATDADTLDKYLKAIDACAEKSRKLEDPGNDREKLVQMYHDTCGFVKEVFDDVFGLGTGVQICGTNDSVKECQEAYQSLIGEYNRQHAEQIKANEAFFKLVNKK